MNKGAGPYKQRPGRGDMPKTGSNKQMAPLMSNLGAHQDHDDPIKGTRTDPAKGYTRPVNTYQPEYQANVIGEADKVVGPKPYEDPDTGQRNIFAYTSATAGEQGRRGSFGHNLPTQRVTTESQKAARSGTSRGNFTQQTFGDGKNIKNKDGNLKTDFSNYNSTSLSNTASRLGMDVKNVNQQELNSIIEYGIKTKNATNKFKDALKFQDMAYDFHRGDSTSTANINKVLTANSEYVKGLPTIKKLTAGGANYRKKK